MKILLLLLLLAEVIAVVVVVVNYQTFKGMVNKSSLTNIHVGVCMSYLVANRTWMWQ